MTALVDPILMADLFREAATRKLAEAPPGSAEAAIKRRVSGCLAGIAADIERECGGEPPSITIPPTNEAAKVIAPALSGDACTNCGNFTLIRTGTCMTCQSCGTTSGCA